MSFLYVVFMFALIKMSHVLEQYKKMDLEGFSKNVHMLKGAANMFECEMLYVKAVAVDTALKEDTVTLDTQLIGSLFNAMENEFTKVTHWLFE